MIKSFGTIPKLCMIALALVCSCKKEAEAPLKDSPILRINQLNPGPFSGTEWQHVLGGQAVIEFTRGSVVLTDSLDLRKISSYQKTLETGTYDIRMRAKSTSAADTFIRFSASVSQFLVEKESAISFSAETKDGLITISKEYVKENTVPTFTTSGSSPRKFTFGLINGYYYLYVNGDQAGNINFTSRSLNEPIDKEITVKGLNHYNLKVISTSTSSINVVFGTFAYNEVAVSANTLLTVEIEPWLMDKAEVSFILTDPEGTVLNVVPYAYEQVLRLTSKEPYNKDRLSVFLVKKPTTGAKPQITAYMNIKKGSFWKIKPENLPSKKMNYPLRLSLKNVPNFDNLTVATDSWNFAFTSPDHLSSLNTDISYTDDSKVYLQVEKDGKAFYNFFDITKGTTAFEADVSQCTKPSLSRTITKPGNGLSVIIVAKEDKDYYQNYLLTYKVVTQTNTITYFYPDKPFEEYWTLIGFTQNGYSQVNTYLGPTIPEQVDPFLVTVETSGESLETFSPSFTGQFDYYEADFSNNIALMSIRVPFQSRAVKLRFPDLATLTGIKDLNQSSMTIQSLEIFQYENFREELLEYKNYHTSRLNGKARALVYR